MNIQLYFAKRSLSSKKLPKELTVRPLKNAPGSKLPLFPYNRDKLINPIGSGFIYPMK